MSFRTAAKESIEVFGAKLTPVTAPDLVSYVTEAVCSGQQLIVTQQNMHGLYVMSREPAFLQLHRLPNTIVHIDGAPLIVMARLVGHRIGMRHRVTMLDWIWELLDRAGALQWRIFFLGGTQTMCSRLISKMEERFPNMQFSCRNGYFDREHGSSDNSDVVSEISEFKPDLVLVGMGMGEQERWVLQNAPLIAPASICVIGACFEYVAGTARTPPRWSGRFGLEWAFRLADQPRRLWFRYLIEPLFVLTLVIRYVVARGRRKLVEQEE